MIELCDPRSPWRGLYQAVSQMLCRPSSPSV